MVTANCDVPASMSMPPAYEHRLMPPAYDAASAALFRCFGGIRRMREEALDRAGVKAGTSVLELGCGTGGFTALMADRGAVITAVDGSRTMLDRARKSVEGPAYRQANMEDLALDDEYRIVLAAFLMHELSPEVRARLLRQCLDALTPDGKLIIVDHSVPRSAWWSSLWAGLLRILEPPSALVVLRGGLANEIERAGGKLIEQSPLARGTVMFYAATRHAV